MQTFVPYADFAACAGVLDVRRLGKQRVEVIQIVRALTVPGYAWASHPAVLMWKGYEEALGRYGLEMCGRWVARGFADTCAETIADDLASAGVDTIRSYADLEAASALPTWLFDSRVQRSHRSALLRKDPDHYAVFEDVGSELEYYWPIRSAAVLERERRRTEVAQRRAQRAAEEQVHGRSQRPAGGT